MQSFLCINDNLCDEQIIEGIEKRSSLNVIVQ